ncbi:unnamed protein product [Parnassius mnemosyne]|uniref:Ion transport domain-containing protein n=1 Tax=Parnassius mnemosyne TaxID=213953 RepID=A0AAV1L2I8_9NEOP
MGPLQISLGRMVIDIVKFFFIYSLVLFAFACGLNQLLWYFADLEKRKCYVLPGGLPDWDNAGDSCMKWRSFGNVFEASQSLFWASFGLVGLDSFELAGIKSYTRFWGLLMFGSYSVINVIVLLNLLIAMMSNSYAMIDKHSDVEWKFARARLWMSYFEENATLPPPFNIFPTPKLFCKLSGLRQKDKLRKMKVKEQKEKENDIRYTAVMRALVWRYVSSTHRKMDEEPVTEENINELKSDVSALRYELLEVFEKNGMDVSFTDRKEKTVLAKRTKIWERRLMKDFQVAPVPPLDDDERHETALARFRRIAKMAISTNSNSMWDKTLAGVGISTQIGRCRTRQSFKNQQNLQRAMDEARKLVTRSPLPELSRGSSPIEVSLAPDNTLLELIKDISTEVRRHSGNVSSLPKSPWKGDGPTVGGFLNPSVVPNRASSPVVRITSPASANASRSTSPVSQRLSPSSRPLSSASDLAPPVARSDTTSLRTPTPLPSDLTQKSKQAENPTGLNEQVDNETKEDIALARPVVSEIKPTEGALPPPPAKPKTPVTSIMEVTPSSPSIRSVTQSTTKNLSSDNKTPSFFKPRPSSPRPSSLQTTSACHSSTSSTEHLLKSPGPKTLRPSIKIDDVNTIKRQPKTGWL